jgi:hypothetical protein
MKQHEAVIKIMETNGGYSTLGFLNQNVFKIKGCEWKTKTPFASIRRIVQDERFFFKIRPGLWALKKYKNKLPFEILPTSNASKAEQDVFTHSYYQGLLVEISNLKKYKTFVPNQDRNKKFLNGTLGEVRTIHEFYPFGYEHIIRKARTIDVSWFNARKMPSFLFEVEHSTYIQNSLLKFIELQDFNISFFIVADSMRKNEFESMISSDAFSPIKPRVRFMDYEKLSEWHTRSFEIAILENDLDF